MEETQAIGYIVVQELTDVGDKGVLESGKSIVHPSNGESNYNAAKNSIIVGRMHNGDENGYTYYRTGKPEIIYTSTPIRDIKIELIKGETTDAQKQSNSNFEYSVPQVIIGRTHSGDENGYTHLTVATLKVDDNYIIKKGSIQEVVKVQESSGKWAFFKDSNGNYLPMTGIKHKGDENENSTYSFSYYYIYEKDK